MDLLHIQPGGFPQNVGEAGEPFHAPAAVCRSFAPAAVGERKGVKIRPEETQCQIQSFFRIFRIRVDQRQAQTAQQLNIINGMTVIRMGFNGFAPQNIIKFHHADVHAVFHDLPFFLRKKFPGKVIRRQAVGMDMHSRFIIVSGPGGAFGIPLAVKIKQLAFCLVAVFYIAAQEIHQGETLHPVEFHFTHDPDKFFQAGFRIFGQERRFRLQFFADIRIHVFFHGIHERLQITIFCPFTDGRDLFFGDIRPQIFFADAFCKSFHRYPCLLGRIFRDRKTAGFAPQCFPILIFHPIPPVPFARGQYCIGDDGMERGAGDSAGFLAGKVGIPGPFHTVGEFVRHPTFYCRESKGGRIALDNRPVSRCIRCILPGGGSSVDPQISDCHGFGGNFRQGNIIHINGTRFRIGL